MRWYWQLFLYAIAVAFTFIVHEGAHWAVGEALGYDLYLRANSAGLAVGAYESDAHRDLVTAAGPAVTVLQGLAAYMLISKFALRWAFAFVMSALMMRIMAAAVSLATPNDEMRLSLSFGFGPWTLFALTIGALALLTTASARRLRFGWREVGFGAVCFALIATAVILGEDLLPAYYPGAN